MTLTDGVHCYVTETVVLSVDECKPTPGHSTQSDYWSRCHRLNSPSTKLARVPSGNPGNQTHP